MARDPQGALVALNRFGFGARGGAAGDFGNAASDPRGFVKAELARPNAALLDVPGLAPMPALARAMFEYQDEVKQARTAAESAKAEAQPDAVVALLAGGALKGGRVIADWPGLKTANLYQARDLAPTTDLRGVIKGVLRDHLGLSEQVLGRSVFPDSAMVKPMSGLVV